MRPALALLLSLLLGLAPAGTAGAQSRLDYPARAGGTGTALTIHGALDTPLIAPLLEDFHHRNPDIALRYDNLTTLAVYSDFLDDETDPRPDVVLSSAMPWQYRLANDGYAQPLESPAARAWPEWARWRHELFAITFEPVVIVYRRELAERFGAVTSHAGLLDLLTEHRQALEGRVVTYDPTLSGAGYSYAIEEARLSPRYWELVASLGSVDTALVGTTREMLEGLAAGRYLLGYNLLGSYARDFVRDHPGLEIAVPDDYALVTQRLAFIPRDAPHPRAARRFLDYLLSEAGQRAISELTTLGAIHPALDGPGTANALRERLGDALRPIRIGPGLLATLDRLKREALLARWTREFRRGTIGAAAPQETSPP
ncbi:MULTISPECIES: ABC transporter substrate-binding protein [unclassified Modicisalibacter]|uniref:ABC transporter substrate-binding protein n=1 Tax=unclassified Modicisalibacter TaxID=2679913 RepID=UPI001CCF7677|nr:MULTISPECIES: ABC transporter substrate-binding protein [unclassified Modicisalibacter]MBZ9560383.1 ABC transporter substrate-binding protein [Modicisalibacter sp. R2A 31.J]MBZ9576292.1 ABC transporter substrate-binding protein [Modicisalibacter sp. MOD 31.J]